MPAKAVVVKTLRLPEDIARQSEAAAEHDEMPWNVWTIRAIEAYLKGGK
jgi:hypothetical protein